MTLQSDLQAQGWNLSQEGIDRLSEGLSNPSAKDVIQKVRICPYAYILKATQ